MLQGLKKQFIDFHRARGFRIYKSFPLLIDDPTILFTNSTVTPFKPMFTGAQERSNFALVQRCLRLGGSAGNLESARLNRDHVSLFDMIGSGLFEVDHNFAVAYFLDVLTAMGLPRERLVFSMLSGYGFDDSLRHLGIDDGRILCFPSASELEHEWSFGEGDLHGCGVVVRYIPDSHLDTEVTATAPGLASYVQIGRIVHIDGVMRGDSVENSGFQAYDLGIGLNRIETALTGNCDCSVRPWREDAQRILRNVDNLSPADAHFMANLFRIVDELVGEGLIPGRKKQAFVLRKIIRCLIEEVWLQSNRLVVTNEVLGELLCASPFQGALRRVIAQEERALRKILSSARKTQRKHPSMSHEDLRSTFGIRFNLLALKA